MNQLKRRSKWAFIITIILLLQIILPYGFFDTNYSYQVSAANEAKKTETLPFKILEIVSTGKSQLNYYLDKNTITSNKLAITTMTMKKFVALRDELDGKYDAIAIMDGKKTITDKGEQTNTWGFTSQGVNYNQNNVNEREKAHNTTDVLNDITNLKANEIIKDFINKGQLVILHQNSISTGEKLNKNFNSYIENKKSNVLLYNQTGSGENSLNDKLVKYLSDTNRSQRPLMDVTVEAPKNGVTFRPGESLTFNYSIQHPIDVNTRKLSIRIYIDTDFNDQYDASEIVVQQDATSSNGQISYVLPKGYSGIRNWKLELVDNGSNLKDYEVGRIKFKDQTVTVNVLQVMPSDNRTSDLTKILSSQMLSRENEYKISITPITMNEFNKTYYKKLELDYEMVIFGFGDMYNELSVLSNESVKVLKRFAESRKSIMFTHDTIYRKNTNGTWVDNVWVDNFMEMTGQKQPETNLGYQARLKTEKADITNEGLMTEYPYELPKTINIATTHNQYYTLDLEDPTIIPWYNITGNNRDVNDSYNHFYTYSKGSVTYSGTGHTNTGFPQDEKQLFVNTMYRAFLGSNQAPIITLKAPKEDAYIPLNQKIELSYFLEDYNLNDKILKTRVFVNDKLEYSNDKIPNGSMVVQSIPHNMKENGKVQIRIEAEDEHGAISQKIFYINVFEIDANLEVARNLEANNPIAITEDVKVPVKYNIVPKEISDPDKHIVGDEITISDINFEEKFPVGLEVLESDAQGTVESGYTIKRKLDPIVYKRDGDSDVFKAEPVTFTINVKPTKNEQYTLNEARILYQEINKPDDLAEAKFNDLTIVAEYPILGLEFPKKYMFNKGQEYSFNPDLKYIPKEAKILSVEWSSTDSNVIKIDANTGAATALSKGEATVTVTVTDIFGNKASASAIVEVRLPIKSVYIDNIELYVGEKKEIPFAVDPNTDEAKNSLSFSLEKPEIASISKETFTIIGNQKGETPIHVSGVDENGQEIIATAIVTVLDYDFKVTPKNVLLDVDEEYDLFTVEFTPKDTQSKNLTWTSSDESIVKVLEPGKIKGLKTGTTTIKVTSSIISKVEVITVTVGHELIEIKGDNVTVEKGKFEQATFKLEPPNVSNIESIKFFIRGNNQKYATVDENSGLVKGIRFGRVPMEIVATLKDGKTKSSIVTVSITEKDVTSDNDKY